MASQSTDQASQSTDQSPQWLLLDSQWVVSYPSKSNYAQILTHQSPCAFTPQPPRGGFKNRHF
jgi:hypothetical protein